MSQDSTVVCDTINAHNSAQYGAIAGQGKGASQALATAGTILLPIGATLIPMTAAAAATGVIMTKGTVDGQHVILINEGGTNSITMAAAGTSFVALGASAVVAANSKLALDWDNTAQLWY